MTVISHLCDWKLQAASSLYDSAHKSPQRDLSLFSLCRNTTALPTVAYQLIAQIKSSCGAVAASCPEHYCSTNSSSQAIPQHQAVQLHSLQLPSWAVHTSPAKLRLNSPPTLSPWSSCLPTVSTLSWHTEESLCTKHSQDPSFCYSFSELCYDNIPLGFC